MTQKGKPMPYHKYEGKLGKNGQKGLWHDIHEIGTTNDVACAQKMKNSHK